jgi:hypothetical protein
MLTATPSGDIIASYGHFESTPYGQSNVGLRVLQGDTIGVQGYTGHTEGSSPPPCGTHLHFQFNPAHPASIDDATNPSSSTNSFVSGSSAPAQAIRQKYWDFGELGFGPSWGVAGWTADRTGTQEGCGSNPYCRLYVHYHPNPVVGRAGSKIELRKHPEPVLLGGQNASHDFNAIAVGRWGLSDAYWVDLPFHLSWLFGAVVPGSNPPVYRPPGPPLIDSIPAFGGLCNSSIGCVCYQRFHVAYIWQHATNGVQAAVFCPDVFPYYPNENYVVDLDDIFAVAGAFGEVDSFAPFQAWPGAWYDLSGNGAVDLDDIFIAAGGFGQVCVP